MNSNAHISIAQDIPYFKASHYLKSLLMYIRNHRLCVSTQKCALNDRWLMNCVSCAFRLIAHYCAQVRNINSSRSFLRSMTWLSAQLGVYVIVYMHFKVNLNCWLLVLIDIMYYWLSFLGVLRQYGKAQMSRLGRWYLVEFMFALSFLSFAIFFFWCLIVVMTHNKKNWG